MLASGLRQRRDYQLSIDPRRTHLRINAARRQRQRPQIPFVRIARWAIEIITQGRRRRGHGNWSSARVGRLIAAQIEEVRPRRRKDEMVAPYRYCVVAAWDQIREGIISVRIGLR